LKIAITPLQKKYLKSTIEQVLALALALVYDVEPHEFIAMDRKYNMHRHRAEVLRHHMAIMLSCGSDL
jgi:hypothetical protein